jgi:hypothetical protein
MSKTGFYAEQPMGSDEFEIFITFVSILILSNLDVDNETLYIGTPKCLSYDKGSVKGFTQSDIFVGSNMTQHDTIC